jgi:Uma2 family endonuclease
MAQARSHPLSFDEFLAWKPENEKYELYNGAIVKMPNPRGKHSEIAGFIVAELNFALRSQQLPWFIPKECTVKSGDQSGYVPDVIILDKQAVENNEPRWPKESVITQGHSIKLIIEVVSTNWRDDYGHKLIDYEALGIQEYWIVDYLGLGGTRYIGSPKQPTLTVCQLINAEYTLIQFKDQDPIQSRSFPNLTLTAQQVFQAST